MSREDLREQHALGEEIANAITNAPLGETIDESELDDELAELEQEQLDRRIVGSGSVPVHDRIHTLPSAGKGESKSCEFIEVIAANRSSFENACTPRGRRRGRRASKAAGRNGHVKMRGAMGTVLVSVREFHESIESREAWLMVAQAYGVLWALCRRSPIHQAFWLFCCTCFNTRTYFRPSSSYYLGIAHVLFHSLPCHSSAQLPFFQYDPTAWVQVLAIPAPT